MLEPALREQLHHGILGQVEMPARGAPRKGLGNLVAWPRGGFRGVPPLRVVLVADSHKRRHPCLQNLHFMKWAPQITQMRGSEGDHPLVHGAETEGPRIKRNHTDGGGVLLGDLQTVAVQDTSHGLREVGRRAGEGPGQALPRLLAAAPGAGGGVRWYGPQLLGKDPLARQAIPTPNARPIARKTNHSGRLLDAKICSCSRGCHHHASANRQGNLLL
mmetsp:Transcript_54200/g.124270  ORF Transcript_54200/g.124270 Transcript_54200/m.124270 type:complete len:217 (+) Transcript_54200:226-876(+)